MLHDYLDKIKAQLELVEKVEKEKLEFAGKKIATCIQNEGIIYLFGSGHSHILTEEVFYRAGGLASIYPILIEEIMLHKGAIRSTELERQNDYAKSFMKDVSIQPEDIVIVISTSGRNPVPIDVALLAKEKGAYVIGLTSIEYSKSQPSKHVSGKHLVNSVDLYIDNHCVKGDALMSHEMTTERFGPSSTVVGAAILNAIIVEAIEIMLENGYEPPIFKSGNLDNADDYNQSLVQKYKGRIPLF
ncbi:SIS domain-containing protein [Pseudalkalibacillus sp. A8]|uniref:SIS domain-containing protein n=1 Tax=Pseudalkalibacillus sp. A8 TaxID=3382641 RepID=UPI0038B42454